MSEEKKECKVINFAQWLEFRNKQDRTEIYKKILERGENKPTNKKKDE